jgi:hypothetical protein
VDGRAAADDDQRGTSEDRLRLPLAFPVEGLLDDLRSLPPGSWVDHFVPSNYEGVWRILPLRGPAGETHPIRMATAHPGQRGFADTPFLTRSPAFRDALARFQCGLHSVRVMSLGPGSFIREHRDPDLDGAGGVVRLHVPLLTHPAVRFLLNGLPVPLATGECWFLRLSDPHSVENPGPTERIHLVIDAELNPWLRSMLAMAALPEPAGRMLVFLAEIGLAWEPAALGESTFLPGLAIHQGELRVDPARLKYPGDILHEAGHLAVTAATERRSLGPGGLEDPGLEMAVLAWSYAACLHLGLAPEVVFHDHGYKGEAAWLRQTFRSGGTLGQPLLAWMGLTSLKADAPAPFPAMVKWLRD